jgi:seryl-tRNA synthetase
MLAMERRHAEELANLRRQSPPPRDVPPPEDLGQLLFNEPNKALKRIREEVGQEIEQKLTRRYQQDQNNIRFWNTFDEQFPDLKNDRDLVELTMNANLSELANIPVESAMERIAELTRDRIQRYTKSRPQGRRPFAEGASPPMPPRQQQEEEKPPSLSELVRRRRAAKQNRAPVA